MSSLLRFSRFIDLVNERIGKASAWLILAAVVICTANALVRYTVNLSSNGWLEIQWYLNSAMFLLRHCLAQAPRRSVLASNCRPLLSNSRREI